MGGNIVILRSNDNTLKPLFMTARSTSRHYNPKAVHFTVQDFGTKHGNDPKYQSKTGDILISAFDTVKNKRVIVDGIHRAAVMSSVYSKDNDYTNRIVYEWRGSNVSEIFPYDFMQFYRNDAPRIV